MNIYSLTFLIIFTVISFTASCQTEKTSWIMGGNGRFNFFGRDGSVSNQHAFDASLSPKIGFFALNNLAVGLSIPLSISTNPDYKSYSIGTGPFVRYYFGKGRINVFPEVQVEFNRSSYKFQQPLGEFSSTSHSTTFGVGPGITYFIADTVGIEGVVTFYTISGNSIDRQGINLTIGFQFYLANKKTIPPLN